MVSLPFGDVQNLLATSVPASSSQNIYFLPYSGTECYLIPRRVGFPLIFFQPKCFGKRTEGQRRHVLVI